MVEGLILRKLSEINAARAQETPPLPPKKRDEMLHSEVHEILQEHWNPLVNERDNVTKELRSYVDLQKSRYYLQPLRAKAPSATAQPM